MNENHNVTTASEFVEACHSHKDAKGVHAFDCRIENNKLKKSTKCTIKQITNYYNFEYRSKGLLVHRSWNIGSGLLIPWSQLNHDQTICTLAFSELKRFCHHWIQTKERSNDELMDIDDCLAQEQESARTSIKQKNVYECDVDGCNAAFIKSGNYINHIVTNDRPSIAEKLSLEDTAMKTYHSKLEKVENRRIISMDVNLTKAIASETNLLPQGWPLPTCKPNTQFSDKQRGYLQKIFDEGVSGVKLWKPKEVVFEMETEKRRQVLFFG